jgi:spore coat polysaccharide biosynthesis protein SpsF
MRKGIIIQARMSSARLSGKSLKLLHGKPMIFYVIDRMKRVQGVDEIILATSDNPSDDTLASYAQECGIDAFRGSLNNVQKRFFDAAAEYCLDVVVRVTGDNPLISHELVDLLIQEWDRTLCDYIGFKECTLGTGAELFTFESFRTVVNQSETECQREHVTPYYYQTKNGFSVKYLCAPCSLYDADLRLTVDTQDDFFLMNKVYERYARNNYVNLEDVIQGVKDAKKSS